MMSQTKTSGTMEMKRAAVWSVIHSTNVVTVYFFEVKIVVRGQSMYKAMCGTRDLKQI